MLYGGIAGHFKQLECYHFIRKMFKYLLTHEYKWFSIFFVLFNLPTKSNMFDKIITFVLVFFRGTYVHIRHLLNYYDINTFRLLKPSFAGTLNT